ncbi:IclR family transcriptional regulator [Planotetraspora mira]|uniref:IclR family transcriptional regulator n=1 Tax=Planotetraspora mira TaxID=58121 RepID=A0A8J3TTB6_9ACTN|nr:IclR family transcriptional regulator [Planotetraspora mira]GII32650.1 hypothetical protein Pmi06nite_60920 [Planotetraspora mira]
MSVAGRLLSVLGAFQDGPESLRLSDIAERTGLPLPTALRMARELVLWGGLERQRDGTYRVGTRLWALGELTPCLRRLRATGRPFLRELHDVTRSAARLFVLDGHHAMVLDELGSPVLYGSRLPAHATAAGRALLADAPETVVDKALAEPARLTPYTITNVNVLAQRLQAVREGGVAASHEEWRQGVVCLAVPVTAGDVGTVAALSVSATPAVTSTQTGRITRALVDAAAHMSRSLDQA